MFLNLLKLKEPHGFKIHSAKVPSSVNSVLPPSLPESYVQPKPGYFVVTQKDGKSERYNWKDDQQIDNYTKI